MSPEKKKAALLTVLRETREIISWLLSQADLREVVARKGRLGEIEALAQRLFEIENEVDYLKEELLRDDLTKLWNRRALRVFFPEILRRITQGKETYLAVFLDICDFREVNDLYGHRAGDKILLKVARRLREWAKGKDVPVRLGGDEFVFLLAVPTLEEVPSMLLKLSSPPVEIHGLKKYLACGATDILASDSLESCLHRADMAMYKHKMLLKSWLQEGRRGPLPLPVFFRA
ncbi:GGDEF domain-containing protein [Thermosulfurimonas sp. F29]|uniref:GGDEF domain-containing protein n=1 Tax=Thermosulfurimonas sp. F29 TaxID=2867247 RepID=UPI001C83EBFE|nr:GGDEF domain-containing protein [Thermosulfurimonas sp. F29]MBX6422546.1 GGDEF domain-containing protein [Thermosulfurimonas sp. F29]